MEGLKISKNIFYKNLNISTTYLLILIGSLIQFEGTDCSFKLLKITYCFENMQAFLIKEQIYWSVLFYEINCPNKRLKLIYILIFHLIRSLLYEFVSLTLLPGLNIIIFYYIFQKLFQTFILFEDY